MENNTAVDKNQVVLEVKNLTKHFKVGTGKNKLLVPAVDGVSFDVYKREVFGLVGESGCGKTTTGRTIIKLYEPTEGFVKLNGDLVSVGHKGILKEIKKLKKAAENEILEIDKHQKEVNIIEKKLKKDIIDADYNYKQKMISFDENIRKINEPKDKYKNKLYEAKNSYEIAVAKIIHRFNLDSTKILESTSNAVKADYEREKAGYELGLKRKTDGLKESAALSKEVIEERIQKLKNQYEGIFSDLEKKYAPLIEDAEKHIVPKAKAKEELGKLTKEKNEKVAILKKQYKEERQSIQKPDYEKIKEEIKKEKQNKKETTQKHKETIKTLKAKAKVEISKVPSNESMGIDVKELKKKIDAITKKHALEVKKLKDEINNAKKINKSKSALASSRKMQMIFQDPISSLNPRLTVEEIVGEGLIIRGNYSKKEIKEKVAETLEIVGLQREYATRYPHEFSGGQRQRIGIARALIMSPDFIIADEPISALDVSIRAQVINLLHELKDQLGLTIMFIAHDLSVVRFFCDRIAVMYYGKIVELAQSEELFNNPMHPYTKSLLFSVPQPDPDYEKNRGKLTYDPKKEHDYRHDKPKLREIVPGHLVYVNDAEFEKIKQEYANGNTKDGDAI